MRVLELALAALALGMALRAAMTPTPLEGGPVSPRERFLIALHDASRGGFWLALAGLFAGFALIDDAASFRWFAIVPILMAGMRLLAATFLARDPSRRP